MRRILLAAGMAATLAMPGAGIAAPSNTSTDVNIGDIKRFVEKGDYDRAVKKARQYLRMNPRSADAYNYLGYSKRQMGEYEDAREAYDRALKIDANHVGAHEYYGELHIKLGDMVSAEKHLAELVRICGNCDEQQELASKLAEAKAGG